MRKSAEKEFAVFKVDKLQARACSTCDVITRRAVYGT
jgi:hypothetical protein